MSPVVGGSKTFWTDFIRLYESLPELWNIRSDCYKNRTLKNKAYDRLIEKLREIEPNANRETVRRKINSFRCSYRRELNKIRESKKIAADGDKDNVYSTNLWYFNLLEFLRDCESSFEVANRFTIRSKRLIPYPAPAEKLQAPVSQTGPQNLDSRNVSSPCSCKTGQESEYDRIGRAWAAELQKMSIDQQIYAKRAVAEIIFKGQLGMLHKDMTTTNNGGQMTPEDAGHFEVEKFEPDFEY